MHKTSEAGKPATPRWRGVLDRINRRGYRRGYLRAKRVLSLFIQSFAVELESSPGSHNASRDIHRRPTSFTTVVGCTFL
jgi:hypothetical protein